VQKAVKERVDLPGRIFGCICEEKLVAEDGRSEDLVAPVAAHSGASDEILEIGGIQDSLEELDDVEGSRFHTRLLFENVAVCRFCRSKSNSKR